MVVGKASFFVSAVGVAAIVAAAMTGASSTHVNGSKSTPPLPISEPTVITDWHQISFPLDAYMQDATEQNLVEKAVYFATKSCMREFGFNFDAPRPYKTPAELKSLTESRGLYEGLYGLFDADQAAHMGYHVYEDPAVAAAVNAREDQYRSEQKALSTEYFHVLTGWYSSETSYGGQAIPEGGCVGAARTEIYGSSQGSALDAYRENLVAIAWAKTEKDARAQTAYDAWSACMRLTGYEYSDPMAANDDPQWATAAASAREIAVAVADVRCKSQTNLVGILMAVESGYQEQEIVTHARELKALEGSAREAVEHAKRLLSQ